MDYQNISKRFITILNLCGVYENLLLNPSILLKSFPINANPSKVLTSVPTPSLSGQTFKLYLQRYSIKKCLTLFKYAIIKMIILEVQLLSMELCFTLQIK